MKCQAMVPHTGLQDKLSRTSLRRELCFCNNSPNTQNLIGKANHSVPTTTTGFYELKFDPS